MPRVVGFLAAAPILSRAGYTNSAAGRRPAEKRLHQGVCWSAMKFNETTAQPKFINATACKSPRIFDNCDHLVFVFTHRLSSAGDGHAPAARSSPAFEIWSHLI